MAHLPQYAKRETVLMRYIKQFHEKLVFRVGRDTTDTLRASAWQIDEYLEEHGQFHDADFLRALQASIEKIIQLKCRTKWSVARAKNDLRGRTRGVNQYTAPKQKPQQRTYVPRNLSKSINSKIMSIPRREFD